MNFLKKYSTKSSGYVVAWAILLVGTISITTMTEVMSRNKANRSKYVTQSTEQLFNQIKIIKAALNQCSESLNKRNEAKRYPENLGNQPTYVIEMWCTQDGKKKDNAKKIIPTLKRIDISPPNGFENWVFYNQNTQLTDHPNLKPGTPTLYIEAKPNNENANAVINQLIDYTLPEKRPNASNNDNDDEKNKPLKNKGKKDKNNSNVLPVFYLELDQ